MFTILQYENIYLVIASAAVIFNQYVSLKHVILNIVGMYRFTYEQNVFFFSL